jgi:hypothetical protein|tara:strand:+ start:170 stop:523 length:354 start_codon:yes stop_codon:yes gene_type:complete
MKELYKIYTDNELWDDTSCPFGTQVLNREAYLPIERSELDPYELCDELTAANIEFTEAKDKLHAEMQWEDEDYLSSYEIWTVLYVYDGYIYHLKTAWIDGCNGYTMSREPQFNKTYI